MKRYSTYKDSGVSWIGEIPEHWKTGKLKYNLKLINDKSNYIPNSTYVGLENIESWTGKYIPSDIIAEGQTNLFQCNDLLFGKLRPYLAKTYKCEFTGCCSPELLVYRTKENVDYFKYLFLSKPFIELIDSSTYGSKMPRANSIFIGSQFLPIPPVSEQQAIVSFLDGKVSEIDDFIVKQEKQIELLKEWKQGEILRIVTKGLNPVVKMKNSGIGWIGKIPEHWKTKRFGSAFIENREINSKLGHLEAYKFYYGSLIRKDIDVDPKEVADTYRKYTIIRTNDIVINGLNLNYDFVSQRVAKVYSDGIITSAYLVFRPRNNVNHQFYLYFFKAMDNLKLFHGMGSGIRLTLSYSDLKNQLIVCPPPSEQQEIVEYIERKTTEADKLIVELTYQVEYLKEYKQSLIYDVVTGKINVQPE